jgi:predicted unusual protein kinase regulating ubiquinone biosynthesis (AarF/ABC1/UbiB family)
MFRIIYSLWNYGWLARYIIQFYNSVKGKTIQENDINQFIHTVIPYIERCGCVCTKFAQWVTPILDNLYNEIDKEPYWLKQLEKFYEQCHDHSLEYTLERYRLDFEQDFYERYTIEDIIGSGSIGQVYKIKDKYTKIYYAMKVLHPNVYHDMWFMKKVVYFLLWIPYTHKIIYDILPINIYEFIVEFETQIDMIHEANNLSQMKYLHKDNSMIVIPDLIRCSRNILVMSYEEGETLDDSSQSDYDKYKCLCLLGLFVRNSLEVNNFIHGDIHKGNWKMKHNQLLIYDFGFCWSIKIKDRYLNENLFYVFSKSTDDDLSGAIEYTCYTLNNHSDKIKKEIKDNLSKSNNHIADASLIFKMICHVAKQFNIYISPPNILGIIMTIQTQKYWAKYSINNVNDKFTDSDSNFRRDYINYISMCETYNIFPKLQENMKDILNKEQVDVNGLFDTLDQSNIITDEIKGLLKFD